ncbi:MAG: putative vacuolar protein sorting-associated protein 35, partial [Streblomastix strix]
TCSEEIVKEQYWMAPEQMKDEPYNYKIDIWKLGITSIELLDGNPPLYDVQPMRVIFLIPSNPPPQPSKPDQYSPELLDFIAKCLIKEPKDRPTVKDLIGHPFIKKYETIKSDVLIPLLQEVDQIKIAQQEEKKKDKEKDKDKEIEKDQGKEKVNVKPKTKVASISKTASKQVAKTPETKGKAKGPVKAAAKPKTSQKKK